MSVYEELSEKGVYFILSDEEQLFAHFSICLAEGLSILGIPIYANRNYWLTEPKTNTHLFNHYPDIQPDDCALCIVDISAQEIEGAQIMIDSVISAEVTKVILNMSDFDIFLPDFEQFMFIFRSHMTSRMYYPYNFTPWAFGISNRIQAATANTHFFHTRNCEALVNFRPSSAQSIRVLMDLAFVPWLEKIIPINRTIEHFDLDIATTELDTFHYINWLQLKGRHNPNYYERLKNSMICCSYGGNLRYMNHIDHCNSGVSRWDSWRFWESLAAGCLTIQLDFEKYGFMLPIMPQNWKHYVGVDLADPKATVERLQDEPELMAQIAAEGQRWALEHYSPTATACYFLDTLTGQELGATRSLLAFIDEID